MFTVETCPNTLGDCTTCDECAHKGCKKRLASRQIWTGEHCDMNGSPELPSLVSEQDTGENPMTSLTEIRERLEAITPGPWRSEEDGLTAIEITCAARKDTVCVAEISTGYLAHFEREQVANATFIAHAPTDIARLLRIAEAAEAYVDVANVDLGASTRCFYALREALEAPNEDT